jgi:dihydrofolate reductase
MEHDSSSGSGYHEPVPGSAGLLGDGDEFEGERELSDPCVINLIWAQADSRDNKPSAIGFEGTLPWHVREDMQRFKELTISHPVIMGRRTWESMGSRPLRGRDNIVVSRNPLFEAVGAAVATSLKDAVDLARQEAIPADGMDRSEIWIIGGSQIFEEILPVADKAYITQLDAKVDADTFVTDLDELVEKKLWKVGELGEWEQAQDPSDWGVERFRYITYERIK